MCEWVDHGKKPRRKVEGLPQSGGDAAQLKIGAYVYPVVPPEFTNWRDEQRASQETCVLFDQTHHMASLFIEGPDAIKLISELSTNSFASFVVGKAKQIAPCNYDGHVVGDGILYYEAAGKLAFIGRNPAANWIAFNASKGGYDVRVTYDDRSPSRPMGKPVVRKEYRFQIQGPKANELIHKLNGGPLDLRFFSMARIKIGKRMATALRHGMAGEPGLEFWGHYEEMEDVRSAVLDAGAEFGIVPVGCRAYPTAALESGWIPSPLPAVYTGETMKTYREWLPATGYEANGSLGGSFVSDKIEDYYTTPYELGYDAFTRFDHDFIGKEALQRMAESKTHRRKVTFAWNNDDVLRVISSMFGGGHQNFKYIDFPLANYASSSYDAITDGKDIVGASMFSGYTFNARQMLSLGFVEERFAKPGTELKMVWGEPGGGTQKTTVERHHQVELRVIVAPTPYSKAARENYAAGWRSDAAA